MPEPFRVLRAKMLRQPPLTVCVQTVDGNGRGPRHSRACKHTLPGSEWSKSCDWSCITMRAVLCAVELALETGVPTNTHLLNLLHKLLDGKMTDQPDVNPPAALSLSKEPEGNVARFDGLRTQKGSRYAS